MYELLAARDREPRQPPPLFGSTQLDGQEAVDAVRAIAEAPLATGRQDARRCGSQPYGFHIVTLLVRSDQGMSRMHLRFSGCGHNGVDAGFGVRELTSGNTHVFVSGALWPGTSSAGPRGRRRPSEAPDGRAGLPPAIFS